MFKYIYQKLVLPTCLWVVTNLAVGQTLTINSKPKAVCVSFWAAYTLVGTFSCKRSIRDSECSTFELKNIYSFNFYNVF